MASAGPMANSMFVVAPPNGYPEIQGGMCQVPPYPSNQPQVHLIPVNPPGLKSSVTEQPAQRAWKEGKVLGAIQILLGLIHVGLGSIMATVLSGHYTAISFYGGFPFWGGAWFIISGSLSVSAENQPKSSYLLNGSLALNIVSAICSVVGITLFIMDMSLSPIYARPDSYPYYDTWGVVSTFLSQHPPTGSESATFRKLLEGPNTKLLHTALQQKEVPSRIRRMFKVPDMSLYCCVTLST
ncbi:membrane-spanning 4-domains subfamily A member 8-like isoform X1 [Panthera onca]